jgi:hypothetical protein
MLAAVDPSIFEVAAAVDPSFFEAATRLYNYIGLRPRDVFD